MAEFSQHAESRRHFLRRLEAFGDIVYGFSISQIAIGLDPLAFAALVQHPHIDALGPVASAVLSFTVLCFSWLLYHRMFATVFVGEPIDVALNFAVLGTIAILPFALRVYVMFAGSPTGLIAYSALFGTNVSLMAILTIRGYFRFSASMEPETRLKVFRRVIRLACIGVIFLATLPLVARFGIAATAFWSPIWIATIATRFIRSAPILGGTNAERVVS